jgi:hypothetical protein
MLTFLMGFSVYAQEPDVNDLSDPLYEKTVRHDKDSFYFAEVAFYSGYGWNSQGCSQCYEEPWTGGWLFGVKMGVRMSKKFATAVIIHFWKAGADLWKQPSDRIEDDRGSFFVHLAGYYYPFRKPSFFLKGSAGLTIFNFTPTYYLTLDNGWPMFETISDVGLGYSLGLGHEFKITKTVFLTPAIDYLYHPFRQLKGDLPNEVLSGAFGSSNLYISLGINWRIPN